MAARRSARKGWQESHEYLKQFGVSLPARGKTPDESSRPARGQRGFPGLTARGRTFEEVDLGGLCLVRTLFVRCRFHGVSFADTDLSLCCLAGCQFVDCDFSGARLIRADLGKCGLFACRLTRCDLTGAELRGATFEHCEFTGADLTGACLDHALKGTLPLSPAQRDRMADWRARDDAGPDGGA